MQLLIILLVGCLCIPCPVSGFLSVTRPFYSKVLFQTSTDYAADVTTIEEAVQPIDSDEPLSPYDIHGNLNHRKVFWMDSNLTVHKSTEHFDQKWFSMITYNILGPEHGMTRMHDYAAESVTKWSRRRDKVVDHIKEIGADIVCLQEVTQKSLKETFQPKLRWADYECFGFAPSKPPQGRGHEDIGSAIFCNAKRIRFLSSIRVKLHEYVPLEGCIDHDFAKNVLSKQHTMVIALVKVKETNSTLVICNAHLYWDPQHSDIKVMQAAAITRALRVFLFDRQHLLDDVLSLPPILICGDMNTLPHLQSPEHMASGYEQSGPFHLFTLGTLPVDHPHHPNTWCYKLRGKNPQLAVLKQPFRLKNCYFEPPFYDYRPFLSTKTDKFSGWIDHMWLTGESLQVEGVLLPPICAGDLRANYKAQLSLGPIPNMAYPSDHIPIGAVFSFLKKKGQQVVVGVQQQQQQLKRNKEGQLVNN